MKNKFRLGYGITGFILLIFLGMIYAWSIFIRPLEAEFGWLRSQTSLIFTISMIGFCVGNLAAGQITPKTSPRVSMVCRPAGRGFRCPADGVWLWKHGAQSVCYHAVKYYWMEKNVFCSGDYLLCTFSYRGNDY